MEMYILIDTKLLLDENNCYSKGELARKHDIFRGSISQWERTGVSKKTIKKFEDKGIIMPGECFWKKTTPTLKIKRQYKRKKLYLINAKKLCEDNKCKTKKELNFKYRCAITTNWEHQGVTRKTLNNYRQLGVKIDFSNFEER